MTPRLRRWLAWQRVPIDLIPIADPVWETRWLLGFAGLYVLLSIATGLLILKLPVPLAGAGLFHQDLWYLCFKVIGLGVVPAAVFMERGYGLRDLITGGVAGARLVWLLPSFAMGLSLNLGHIGPIVDLATGIHPTRAALLAGAGILLPLFSAGLPEEIVYRGLLQTRIEFAAGRTAALFATALLFVAWHLPTRLLLSEGVEGQRGDLLSVLLGTGLPVLAVALVFGLLWDRYRNLPCLIAAHWGIDLLPSVRSMLGGSF